MTIKFNIPVFTGKEDPNHWLFRLEKIAKVNKWNDDEKLVYADNFLSEPLQMWSMGRQFKNFEQFTMELIAKHTKKVDLNKVVSDITTFKMKQGEKINEYIERFEVKRNAYQTEVIKRKLILQESEPTKSAKQVASSSKTDAESDASKAVTKDEPKDEDVIELIITDTGFLKYFIKGITDKGMKRFVKSRKNSSLQSLYDVLRDIYDDSDSEYDSEASNSSGGTDSEEDKKRTSSASKSVKPKDNKAAKSKDNNTVKAYDMEDLTAQFKDMALMIVEEIRKGRSETTSQGEPIKRKKINCYNCQEENHIAQNCKNPCKLCKSKEHVHFQCPQYQGRKSVPGFSQGGANQSSNQSESMFIEEDVLMAEKRKISDVSSSEINQSPHAKRAPRVTRSGAEYSVPVAKPRAIREPDTQMGEASSSRATVNIESVAQPPAVSVTNNITVRQKLPEHPLLPMEQPGDNKAKVLDKVERIVDRIVNEKVIPMSFSDVAALPPAARAKIKQTLTKSQTTRKARGKRPLNDQPQALIGEPELSTPKGKSAPRAYDTIYRKWKKKQKLLSSPPGFT